MPLELEENLDDFESVINDETPPPAEEEETTQTPGDKQGEEKSDTDEKAEKETEEKPEPVTVEGLAAKVAQLEKSEKGKHESMMAERRKRQDYEGKVANLEGRLSQINDLLAKVREGRGTKAEEAQAEKVEKAVAKIPVAFDDDGNPFLPEDKLLEVLKKVQTPVEAKVTKIEERDAARDVQNGIVEATKAILVADEAYPQAYQTLRTAFSFLDKALTQIVSDQELDPKTLDMEKALTIMEGSKELTDAFTKQFPGIDMDTVVEALAVDNGRVNSRKLTKALNIVKSNLKSKETDTAADKAKQGKEKVQTLKTLANKASNLASVRNQKVNIGPTLDDLANLDIDAFMALPDDEYNKINKLVKGED